MLTENGWDPNNMMNGDHGGGIWMMLVLGLLLVAVLGTATFLVLRAMVPGDTRPIAHPQGPSPREVLDQRLARGEISPEDYTHTRSLLGS